MWIGYFIPRLVSAEASSASGSCLLPAWGHGPCPEPLGNVLCAWCWWALDALGRGQWLCFGPVGDRCRAVMPGRGVKAAAPVLEDLQKPPACGAAGAGGKELLGQWVQHRWWSLARTSGVGRMNWGSAGVSSHRPVLILHLLHRS